MKTPLWLTIVLAVVAAIIIGIQFYQMSQMRLAHYDLWHSYAHYYYCDEPTHPNATKCATLPTHIPPPPPPPK